jgi:hypothetical protein
MWGRGRYGFNFTVVLIIYRGPNFLREVIQFVAVDVVLGFQQVTERQRRLVKIGLLSSLSSPPKTCARTHTAKQAQPDWHLVFVNCLRDMLRDIRLPKRGPACPDKCSDTDAHSVRKVCHLDTVWYGSVGWPESSC